MSKKIFPVMPKKVFEELVDMIPGRPNEIIIRRDYHLESPINKGPFEFYNLLDHHGAIVTSSVETTRYGSKSLIKRIYEPNKDLSGINNYFDKNSHSYFYLISAHWDQLNLTPTDETQVELLVKREIPDIGDFIKYVENNNIRYK